MMKRNTLLLLMVLVALTLYGLLIYSWWIEGNINFEQQRLEQQNENTLFRH